jgi:hypothetical protein
MNRTLIEIYPTDPPIPCQHSGCFFEKIKKFTMVIEGR